MGTFKGYRGNADIVMDDADVIVNRLKTTPVTIHILMREYRCTYETLTNAIYSRITKEQYRQIAIQHLSRGNKLTCFKKGHKAWNKNAKGMHLSPATEFKKGHLPANHREVGTILVCKGKNGKHYRRIKISGRDQGKHRWISYAQYLWEKENGPIPDGKLVAHTNGAPMDDRPENLILVDRGGLINLMRKNNPGHRKKAIRNIKKTCRIKRKEREAGRKFKLKLKRRKEKLMAVDLKHQQIAEAGIVQFRGPMETWYECKGCGYEMSPPRPPCPKCGHLAFELIEQPVELARRHAAVNE